MKRATPDKRKPETTLSLEQQNAALRNENETQRERIEWLESEAERYIKRALTLEHRLQIITEAAAGRMPITQTPRAIAADLVQERARAAASLAIQTDDVEAWGGDNRWRTLAEDLRMVERELRCSAGVDQ